MLLLTELTITLVRVMHLERKCGGDATYTQPLSNVSHKGLMIYFMWCVSCLTVRFCLACAPVAIIQTICVLGSGFRVGKSKLIV